MSKFITLGFKSSGEKPELIYGTETSFENQREWIRSADQDGDSYEAVGIYEIKHPVKYKKIRREISETATPQKTRRK